MTGLRASITLLALGVGLAACAGDPGGPPASFAASCAPGVDTAVVRQLASAGVAGCATELNLRLMLADPRDLAGGPAVAGPSGDAAFAAVRRHGQGEVKPLPRSSASGPSGD